ncbi:MAG: hypothetical protein AAF514_18605 [Verrucomicrobiota bacterium]
MKTLFTSIAAGLLLLAGSAVAQDSAVAKSLKGNLVAVDGKSVKDFELKSSPEHYVVYHSASW